MAQAIEGTPGEELCAVATQIDPLLTSRRSDRALKKAVGELCDYYPPGDGVSDREWLLAVQERLRRA